MAGKGTCESFAILGLVATIRDQFVLQTDMTSGLRDIIDGIDASLNTAWALWSSESLMAKDLMRIQKKLESLSDKIPMDREVDITVGTAFMLSLLEDMTRKLKPFKQNAIRDLIKAVLMLHNHYENERIEDLIEGAKAADAWEAESVC